MKKITLFKSLILAIIFFISSASVSSQILTFEFSALVGSEVSAPSSTKDLNLMSSTITRGAGLTASGNAGRFNATNWALTSIANAVSGNNYMEITISPNSGYQFSVSSIYIQMQRSSTGPSQIALRSSVDNYTTDLNQVYSVSDITSTQNFTFTFTQTNSTAPVTYRFYMYAETTSGSGGIGDGTGDDIVVNGVVSSAGGNPIAATPTFTVVGSEKTTDTYWNTANVALASTTEGASIYYTTNGDTPTSASTLYSGAFDVTATTTVKAIAVKSSMDDSSVAEKTITIATPVVATIPYSEAFNSTLGDWFSYQVSGAKPWLPQTTGAYMNGYGGGAVDSWLISPKFTAATTDGLKMTFNYASKYTGNALKVKVSSDYIGYGNPSAATWTDVSTIAAPTIQDINYTVYPSGNIIAAMQGTVYFALVYTESAAYSDWRITDLTVDAAPAAGTPTITVTEVTIPEMIAYAGETITEAINVSGINLTNDITLAVTGTDASLFELSIFTVPQTGGTAASTEVTIKYKPITPGTHTATLTLISSGAENVVRTLNGSSTWKPLAAPVATNATASNTSGFTANWEAVTGATEYQLDVYTITTGSTNATDLIISEYVEGSSYNKAIEIYNGTGATVDLAGYSIKKQVNGAGEYGSELVLSGNLVNGEVYVIAYVSGTNSASAGILAVTDLQTSSSALNYNGNDAVALFKGTVQIDEVGIFNQVTPNWGTDVTLIRKSSVLSPKVPYDAADWDSNASDYIDNLGSHTMSGTLATSTPIAESPFTVTGATTKALTGLDAGTTYYYTVIAKNANVTSPVSNEIIGNTLGTSLENAKSDLTVISVNGNIKFSALAGESVEVYSAIGQKLISKTAVDGVNTIPVAARGVVLVKVGTKISKVIM